MIFNEGVQKSNLLDGLIIAFEGLDCSFKETNYIKFINRISSDMPDQDIITASFPRYQEDSSIFLKKWLNNEYDRELLSKKPLAINSCYALDRLDFWMGKNNIFRRSMMNYRDRFCFIFDRYSYSNSIYNPMYPNQMPNINDFKFDNDTFGIPYPDIVVWMRMKNFGVLLDLISQKKDKDKNELDTAFLEMVWNRSEYMIKHNWFEEDLPTSFITIDCLNDYDMIKSRDLIASEVYKQVINTAEKIKKNRKEYR